MKFQKAIDCIVRNHYSVSDYSDEQLQQIEEILAEMKSIGPANDMNWRKISGLGQDLVSAFRSGNKSVLNME